MFNAKVEGKKLGIIRDGSKVRTYTIDGDKISGGGIEATLDQNGNFLWKHGYLSRRISYDNSKTFIGNTVQEPVNTIEFTKTSNLILKDDLLQTNGVQYEFNEIMRIWVAVGPTEMKILTPNFENYPFDHERCIGNIDDEKGLTVGAIVGIVLGTITALVLCIPLMIYFFACCTCQLEREEEETHI